MECKNKRYVADPFIAFEAVNYPAETSRREEKKYVLKHKVKLKTVLALLFRNVFLWGVFNVFMSLLHSHHRKFVNKSLAARNGGEEL